MHEVAHVVGAGNAMSTETGNAIIASTSIIVKMIRVMMLVPVLLILAFSFKSPATDGGETAAGAGKQKVVIPWFAILFLLVIVLNSIVTLPSSLIAILNTTSTFFLTMAMTALGVETSIDKFRQAGAKPFILAFILFLWLIIGGWIMAKYLLPLF